MSEKELFKKFQYWKKQIGVNNQQEELLAWYAVKWAYKLRKKEENIESYCLNKIVHTRNKRKQRDVTE